MRKFPLLIISMALICSSCTGAMAAIEDDAEVVIEEIAEVAIEDVIDKRIAIFFAKIIAATICAGCLFYAVRKLALKECKRLASGQSNANSGGQAPPAG